MAEDGDIKKKIENVRAYVTALNLLVEELSDHDIEIEFDITESTQFGSFVKVQYLEAYIRKVLMTL